MGNNCGRICTVARENCNEFLTMKAEESDSGSSNQFRVVKTKKIESSSLKHLQTLEPCPPSAFSCTNLSKKLENFTTNTLLFAEYKIGVFEKENCVKYKINLEEINQLESSSELIFEKGEIEGGFIYYGSKNKSNLEKKGFGIQHFSNGSKYEGYWDKNMYNLFGRLIKANGDVLEGHWIDNELSGYGIEISKSFEVNYIGDFQNSLKHGFGILTTKHYKYTGFFQNNKRDGTGEIEYTEDQKKVEGLFSNNDFVEGTLTIGGILYSGKFKNYELFGQGKMVDSEKLEEFEGEFKDGLREGFGRLKRNGELVYEGQYKNDVPHGSGSIFQGSVLKSVQFKNGSILKS